MQITLNRHSPIMVLTDCSFSTDLIFCCYLPLNNLKHATWPAPYPLHSQKEIQSLRRRKGLQEATLSSPTELMSKWELFIMSMYCKTDKE
jgi:hypothetical protein